MTAAPSLFNEDVPDENGSNARLNQGQIFYNQIG
jgi:hypothetical protein